MPTASDHGNGGSPAGEYPVDIDRLMVFDTIEVGPIRVEAQRITAPYRVQKGGHWEETQLIVSYGEHVLDPHNPGSINLANMIAAQVAINYGLFCKQLVFKGLFDPLDRRFIRQMAENTAREIYVNKFLKPNPFLLPPVDRMAPRKQRRYLNADIVFASGGTGRSNKWKMWESRPDRYCVLSSGGKDSLLSFGLLHEIIAGRETSDAKTGGLPPQVHPIFVNESGRHWFTAVNAYRYFKEHYPHTARVWVNSDRVFSWMLRQMPFIRPDFAGVRSDMYPVRLWTVAVFLFAVLPVLRKHHIGRLVIGDEFDTTVKARDHGIPHYDGLYDQSIFFDTALSRYFLQKGWAVSQFSLLRPMSELLIEKTLVERYPHLQRLQLSCHAAHKEGERMEPCGRCEKCRRIVGMLVALGADPRHCGYRQDQIDRCLKEVATAGLHQEDAAVEHLLAMLGQAGVDTGDSPVRRHEEILSLRLDAQNAPLNAIPMDLRRPLLTRLLEHAAGTVQRRGRTWVPVDPFSLADFSAPHAFSLAAEGAAGLDNGDHYLWGELTWCEAERHLKHCDVALLPVGAVEQHGPHLPLDTDAFDADYLARRVAEACSSPRPLVLPLISYGVSYHHDDFRGTIGIGNQTLSTLVYDIGCSIAAQGIHKMVIINGHGGNSPALNYAAQLINRDTGIFVCVDTGETSDVDIEEIVSTPNDVHAGEIETSTSLAIRPHLVRKSEMVTSVPSFSSRYLDFSSRRGVNWYTHTHNISASGVMGDPAKATAEKGLRIWEVMIAHLVTLVEELKQVSATEIGYGRSQV